MPQPRLIVRNGLNRYEVNLNAPVFRIGRSLDNDEVIEAPYVSRHHCEIRSDSRGFVLVDVGSQLGTKVNGMVSHQHVLHSGDVIRVGDIFEAIFVQDGQQAALSGSHAAFARQLVALDGPLANQSFPLSKDRVLVGRGMECDIRIALDTISTHHAELVREAGDIVLIDLQSTNGTFIGDKPIRRHKLKPGELIRFDWVVFRYEDQPRVYGKTGTRIRRPGESSHHESTLDPDAMDQPWPTPDRSPLHAEAPLVPPARQDRPWVLLAGSALVAGFLILIIGAGGYFAWKKMGPRLQGTETRARAESEIASRDTSDPSSPGLAVGNHQEEDFSLIEVRAPATKVRAGQEVFISFDLQINRDQLLITEEHQLYHGNIPLFEVPNQQKTMWTNHSQRGQVRLRIPQEAQAGSHTLHLKFYSKQTAVDRSILLEVER